MRLLPQFLFSILVVFFIVDLQAAKIDSIDGNVISVFLETLDDEDVTEGQTVYLTNSSGQKIVTLKVEKNRGTYADMKVVSGTPKKTYKVLMPHQAKATKKVAKKAVKKVVKKITPPPVKKKPRPQPKIKKQKKTTVAKKVLPAPKKVAEEEWVETEVEATSTAFEYEEAKKQETTSKSSIVTQTEDQEEPPPAVNDTYDDAKWVVSTDILTLAGIIYNFQLFSLMAERAIIPSLSLGVRANFFSYIGGPSVNPAGVEPLVRRTEVGAFARYHFGKSIAQKGFFLFTGFKFAFERWSKTPSNLPPPRFSSAKDGGNVFSGGLGYQFTYSILVVRLGYHLQFSSLENLAEFEDISYQRSPNISTGFGHYGLLQVGARF